MTTHELKMFAAEIRLWTLKCIGARGFGHLGGALSVIDALAVLYSGGENSMKIDPKNPKWKERDKLVMSKGHAGPALYATLALKGYFDKEVLKSLNQPGTTLPSHCDMKLTPGVDMTTGSLGQGVSTAIGLALAQRLDGKGARTFLFTGDGELNEGQVWEGALFAPSQKLNNLIWFIDYNKKQLDAKTDDIIPLGDIAAKVESFGWAAQSINGNDVAAITEALKKAAAEKSKPSCIVLNTKKGAGVPLIEETEANHSITFEPETLQKWLLHIENVIAEIKKEAA